MTEFWYSLIPFVKRTKMQVVEVDYNYVKMLLPYDNNGDYFNNMFCSSLLAVCEIAGAGALAGYYGKNSKLF